MNVAKSELAAEDFPFTIEALREDNEEVVWAVTVLRPKQGERIPLYIPPLAAMAGCGILVRTTNGMGLSTTTGPYQRNNLGIEGSTP